VGSANALAQATTAAGQLAQANAMASGSGGFARTAATTGATGFVSSFTGDAQSSVTGAGATAASLADAVDPFSFNGDAAGAYVFGTIAPNAAYVSNALSSHSNVADAFASPFATVFAAGVQGAYDAVATGAAQEYVSSENFTLNGSTMSGHLVLGLLDDQALATGFTSLAFTVTVAGVTDITETFTTLAAAQSYFSDDALDLGTFASKNGLTVGVGFDLTTSAAGVGFGEDFVLGVTDANAPPRLTRPATVVVQQGQASPITGVTVSEADPLPQGQSITVTLADSNGLLSVVPGNARVTGLDTTRLTVTGNANQINAALETLADTDAVAGTDTIGVYATDTRGGRTPLERIAVTIEAPSRVPERPSAAAFVAAMAGEARPADALFSIASVPENRPGPTLLAGVRHAALA
jgi:hypothetical protein